MAAPYTGKLQVEAYEAGKKAHAEGREQDSCPTFSKRSLAAAWVAGWKSSADERRRQQAALVGDEERWVDPQAEAAAFTPPEDPLAFWPADKPLPTVYLRPPIPCPACRRVLTADGGRAALQTQGAWEGVVRFRCKACGNRWKLAAGPRFN